MTDHQSPATMALARVQRRYPRAGITKISEAAQDISFEITARQATGGVQLNPVLCAIGKSLKACPGVTGVLVHRSRVLIIKGSACTRYVVPPSLKREIDAFDKPGSGRFKPGRYTLKAPSKYERLDIPRRDLSTKRLQEGKTKTRNQPDDVRQW